MKEKKKRMRSILTEDFFEDQQTNNEIKETPKDRISEEQNISQEQMFKDTEQADKEINSEPAFEKEFHKQSIEEILAGTGLPTPEEFFKEQDKKNEIKEESKKKRSFLNHEKEKQKSEVKSLFDNFETVNIPTDCNEEKANFIYNKADINKKEENQTINTSSKTIENAAKETFNNTEDIARTDTAFRKADSYYKELNSEGINEEKDTESKTENSIKENTSNNVDNTIYNEESNMLKEKEIQEVAKEKDEKTLLKERLERELQERIARRNQIKETNKLEKEEKEDKEAALPQEDKRDYTQKEPNIAHRGLNETTKDLNNNESIKERLERELREKIAKRNKSIEAEAPNPIEIENTKQEEAETSTVVKNETDTTVHEQSEISGAMVIGSMVLGSSAIQTTHTLSNTAENTEDNQYNEQNKLITAEENIKVTEGQVAGEVSQNINETKDEIIQIREIPTESSQKTESTKDEKDLLKERLERELREKIQKREQKEIDVEGEISVSEKNEATKVIEDVHKINEERLPQVEKTLNTKSEEELTNDNNVRNTNDIVIDRANVSDKNVVVNKPLKREEDKSKEEKEKEDRLREREELERELLRKIEENDKAEELKQIKKEATEKNTFKKWFKSGKNEKNEEQKEQAIGNTQLRDKEESPKDDKGKFLDVLAKYSK